eukprot:jgi/Picre1/31485/NNA_006837.t1
MKRRISNYTGKRAFSSARERGSHWLDRFEKVQHALEDMTRTWWIKGLVESRCKTRPELAGHSGLIRRKLEEEYQTNMRTHCQEYSDGDSRSRLHVSVASLILATHSCLTPFIRNEQEVVDIIREHGGGKTTPVLEFLLKMTSILHRDAYKTLQGRLRGLQSDYGAGFQTTLACDPNISTLKVHDCLYDRILTKENKRNLLSCCCCSQDKLWLLHTTSGSMCHAELLSSKAEGDDECTFFVRQRPIH